MSRPDDFKFDPYDGLRWVSSVPIQVETYRTLYPKRVWWHNPWTGVGRSARDVNDNPFMENVAAPRTPAAAQADECCAQEGMGAIKYVASESAIAEGASTRDLKAAFQKYKPFPAPPVDFNSITVDGVTYTWRSDSGPAGLRKARDYLDMLLKTWGPK